MLFEKSMDDRVLPVKNKLSTQIAFIFYLLILVKLTLLKYSLGYMKSIFGDFHIQYLKYSVNRSQLIPFRTINHYLFNETGMWVAFTNLFGNVFMFLPAGIFFHQLFPVRINNLARVTLVSFALSMGFELVQLATILGQFDVDDLLLNTVGAIIGFKSYTLWKKSEGRGKRYNNDLKKSEGGNVI